MTLDIDLGVSIGGLEVACSLTVERGETVAVVGPNGAVE